MCLRWFALLALAVVAACGAPGNAAAQAGRESKPDPGKTAAPAGFFAEVHDQAARGAKLPAGVPAKVGKILAYVDKHDEAMEGYEGGRNFGNFENRLARADRRGKTIKYREWDVNPHRPGVNRGAERLITGSDGSAYYTGDHYETFKKIR